MVDAEIERIVLRFAKALEERGLHIDKVIVFGSYAGGRPHQDSDIDVAVVSPDFGRDRYEEGKILFQTAWRIDPRLEPVPISSQAYEQDTWIPLVYEIRQKGAVLSS